MKTETTSGGMGKLILRLILSILLVFSLLGTVGCAVGISVLHSPSQLIAQMHKQNAGQKVYDSLQTRFTTDYNTTAVPANVYMDAISVDWLEQCMEQKLTALYGADSDLLDFSALESSITDYFEKYAEENHYVKDDTYNEKLQETIDNGEKIISDATDLLRKDTLQKAGYLSKLEKLRTLTFAGAGVCGVLTVLLLVLLREAQAPSGVKLQGTNTVHSENEIIRHAQQYISAHIREKLSVRLIAQQVDVSPSYLTVLFQKNLQISPGEYIRRIKLQESKQMIRENNLNFTEIAAALQYSTVHHFSRQFKEKFGITPTEYARSVR